MVIPSVAHRNFHSLALLQLSGLPKFSGTIKINYTFFQKGRLSQDFDNAMGAINDLLQDAGLVENDKYIKKGEYVVIQGAPEFLTLLEIEEIEEVGFDQPYFDKALLLVRRT